MKNFYLDGCALRAGAKELVYSFMQTAPACQSPPCRGHELWQMGSLHLDLLGRRVFHFSKLMSALKRYIIW